MSDVASLLFESSPHIRYVATYLENRLKMNQRPGTENASAAESDKYEELIVNPTLVKLLQQRGNIDCGGMEYVLIRYGNFFELVQPLPAGHISVGIQLDADLASVVSRVRSVVEEWLAA